jgi:hypothetical protein
MRHGGIDWVVIAIEEAVVRLHETAVRRNPIPARIACRDTARMKQTALLTTTSVITLLLAILHLTTDIVFKIAQGGLSNLTVVLMGVVWLYGTLVLRERRAGYIIIFLGSLLALGVSAIHMRGAGMVGGRVGASGQAFFWVWTLLTLGVTAAFSAVLSARALWDLPWRRQP